MSLLDANALDSSLAALEPMASQVKQPMVRISIEVPLRDVDFTHCDCAAVGDWHEVSGRRQFLMSWETDFSRATFNGIPCAIEDCSIDDAHDYLISLRSESDEPLYETANP